MIWSKTHHSSSKIGGTHEKYFVWTPSLGFGHPILVILSLKKRVMKPKNKNRFHLFSNLIIHDSVALPWIGCLSGPFDQCIVPSTLCYDRWSWDLIHYTVLWNFFPQKFPSSHFPLSTSHHFHFPIDIPSELAPWHHSLWTRPEKWVRVWRTTPHQSSEPSLNLHRRVYLSVIVSIPFSPFPRCNIISQVQ